MARKVGVRVCTLPTRAVRHHGSTSSNLLRAVLFRRQKFHVHRKGYCGSDNGLTAYLEAGHGPTSRRSQIDHT